VPASVNTPRQLRLSLDRDAPAGAADFVHGPSNAEASTRILTSEWPDGALALVGPAGSGKSHLARVWLAALDGSLREVVEDADRGFEPEALFHLLNLAARGDRRVLLTARTRPVAWPAALPDLRSRLNALPVVEIAAPDDTVLEAVLRRFFRDRHIRPPEEVYPYLLARMPRSIPDAAEIVRRLDEAGDDGFKPVTRVLARQILEAQGDLDL
jgi:chromosomal replication initiation ATPase DnaA